MRTRYVQILYINVAITCIFILLIMPGVAISKDHGFYPGEKLTFKVRWSVVTAAIVTLEILPYESINGEQAFHFLYTAKTSKFVDAFYKVRDRIESYTNINLTHSLLYKKRHEGKSIKDITVEFDWKKNEARYINKGEVTDSVQINKNTFDPLSVFYAFRVGQPDSNNEIKVNVADGKKLIKGTGKILKKQKIKISGKSYNTLLVEPEMEGVSGVFKKSKKSRLQIWVTDDKRRIPVKIKSKVTVGSFIANLVSYTPGNDENFVSSEPVK
ncbi:MAG: DUF3108 domain-containing protein [Desulfobacteraceae bacterium]|jgi:hypothetical protein